MIAWCGTVELLMKFLIPELSTCQLSSILNHSVLIYVLCDFEMRVLHFQAHSIILAPTRFSRLFLPGHIEPQRLQMPNASFSNQRCHHHDPSAGTGQIPSIQPAVPHQSERVTRWVLKHWVKENIWKCLRKAVNYFTDKKINNNWRIMGVNFKDELITESIVWAT